jgi:hypothetical protein
MSPIPLFVELCAGTAALSLRLHRDGARPPVSRMGAKTGYADCLLRVLGLIPGQRADRYLWCEPDPGVRLLLHAYRSAPLAKAAAAIIRGWAAEDPRALWERLRAEGPPRLPDGEVEAGEVARWARIVTSNRLIPVSHDGVKWCNSARNTPGAPTKGGLSFGGDDFCTPIEALAEGFSAAPGDVPAVVAPDARDIDPREVARVIQILASNELINVAWSDAAGRWKNTGKGGTTFGGPIGYGADRSPAKMDGLPEMPAVVVPDAREVDPREVARWVWTWGRSFNTKGPDAGFLPSESSTGTPVWNAHPPEWYAAACDRLPAIPGALIHPDARGIDPPALPPGTVCYMDPPYLDTTGYAHDLPRAEVVALARRWAAAGATVAISEAEPIPELVAEGWHAVRIDGERVGQKRTFSKQQAEWLTLSRPPAWVPPVQGGLFGGGR